jgi:hypothetical protein
VCCEIPGGCDARSPEGCAGVAVVGVIDSGVSERGEADRPGVDDARRCGEAAAADPALGGVSERRAAGGRRGVEAAAAAFDAVLGDTRRGDARRSGEAAAAAVALPGVSERVAGGGRHEDGGAGAS